MLSWIRKIDFLFNPCMNGKCPCEKMIVLEGENRKLRILLHAKKAVIKELKRGIKDGREQNS